MDTLNAHARLALLPRPTNATRCRLATSRAVAQLLACVRGSVSETLRRSG